MDKNIPHILIVDDDANLLATMSDILKLKGFEPVVAPTGAAALVQIEQHHFDLALVDLRLDDMSGLIVLRAVKIHSPETECILLTGHASQNSAIEAIQAGVFGFFQKPFDMEQVLLSIQRALEKTAAGKALSESERFAHATVDALSAHLAILDETGTILSVNRAWREFAKANYEGDPDKVCEGVNYLSVCDTAKGKYSEDAPVMAAGIRAVMSGEQTEFLLEYPCHSPNEKRWFTARVTRFPGASPLRVVVAHENITERKHAEQALVENEVKLKKAERNASLGYYDIDTLSGKTNWSEETYRIFGLDVSAYDPNVSDYNQYLHKDDVQKVFDLYEECIKAGKPFDLVYRIVRPDGEVRHVHSKSAFTADEENNPTRLFGTIQDVTERIRAEEAVKESEEKFRNFIEQSTDGLAIFDEQGQVIEWNRAVEQISGLSKSKALGLAIWDIQVMMSPPEWPASALDRFKTSVSETLKTGRSSFFGKSHEAGLHTLTGEIKYVQQISFPIKTDKGYCIGSVIRDITERKQAEEKLAQSEKRFQSLIENAPDGVVLVGLDGKFKYASPAALRIFGYNAEDIHKQNPNDLTHPEDIPLVLTVLQNLITNPTKVSTIQYRFQHKDGSWRWVESTFTNLLAEPSVEAIVINFRDVTERKQAQDAQRESELQFRVLFDLSPDAVLLIDPHAPDISWPIIDCNEAACRMNGYRRDELVGHSIDIVNTNTATRAERNAYLKQVQEAGTLKLESLHRHKDGTIFPIEVSTKLIKIGDRELVIGIDRNITERKQAEEALRKSESLFASLFHANPTRISITRFEDSRFLDVNETFLKSVGYTREEVVGHTSSELNDWADPRERTRLRNLLEKQGRVKDFETQLLRKSGETMDVLISAELIELFGETCVLSVGLDITERKQAEAEIRERTEELELINTLNEAANRGENLDKVIELFAKELRKISVCKDATVYLISPDGEHLIMQHLGLPLNLVKKIEQLLGMSIPQIEIPIREGGFFHQALHSEQGIITTDPKDIQQWMLEFAETKTLPAVLRGAARSLIPQIYQLLDIGSTLVVPLISDKKVIGLLDVSSAKIITERDLGRIQKISSQLTAVILREQANESLLESEKRYRTIFDGVQDAIFIETKEGKVLEVNNSACEMYGYTRDEFLTKTVSDFVLEGSFVFAPHLTPNKQSAPMETINRRANGELFPIEISGGVQVINGQEVNLAIIRDITGRKQAEENIRQHVRELELLYESGLIFSQLLNPQEVAKKIIELLGEKLDWHHTAIRLIRGQDELELVAFDQPGLEDQAEAQVVKAHFSRVVSRIGEGLSGWALQQSKTVRLGDVSGNPHYVETFPGIHSGLYVPLKSGDRRLGVISIESELPDAFSEADEQVLTTLANQAANAFENARLYQETNRHAQELEQRVRERTADLSLANSNLARAVRVKDEFLASMSHELRTPLTGILGLSEALQSDVYGELNEKQGKTLKIIEDSGRHLLDLINDILDLSKIEAGKLELQFAPCSLTDICQASLQLIKGMAQKKSQQVHYIPPPEPIIIHVDARRLKQLLVNLLSNAIKFTPQNGELGLEVQINKDERNFQLIVWDKGIGIKTEELQNIFKPFVQLDSGLAREYSGTGLGLSLVQHLTELHNGGIEVQSKIGEGSRFIISLPWSSEDTVPMPYMPKRATTGGLVLPTDHSKSHLVMIADDNEMVLQMVADFLEANQYRVVKVRNGTELLGQASELHPDIMLVDIQMPGIGGLETIRRIRSHPDPRIAGAPVIAVTALAMPADREHCLRAGANEYMSKPLKLKALVIAIQKLLERKP